MKYKIEKNTVQETLIIPLYARKVCSELYPNLYQDETAVRLINEIDYDFSDADKNARSLMQHAPHWKLFCSIRAFMPCFTTVRRTGCTNTSISFLRVRCRSLRGI
mgnify:CR=1 FL=1